MTTTTFTRKITSIYVAYAPEFNVSAYGGCRDEALNNLTEEIHLRNRERSTGEERKTQ